MSKVLILKIDGCNWFVKKGNTTTNATLESVNDDNYLKVKQVGMAMSKNPIQTMEELETFIFFKIGNDKLWDMLPRLIDESSLDLSIEETNMLCQNIENQARYREDKILAFLDTVELEGTNMLNICAINDRGFNEKFSVDLRKKTIGNIVS